jgi:hypothetical protein
VHVDVLVLVLVDVLDGRQLVARTGEEGACTMACRDGATNVSTFAS